MQLLVHNYYYYFTIYQEIVQFVIAQLFKENEQLIGNFFYTQRNFRAFSSLVWVSNHFWGRIRAYLFRFGPEVVGPCTTFICHRKNITNL